MNRVLAITLLAALVAFAGTASTVNAQCGQKDFFITGSVPIPDNNATGATISLVVPPDPAGCNLIGDVNVDTIIAHSWQGDLTVSITDPGGLTITPWNRPGVPQSTFGFSNDNVGNPVTGVPFVWDDQATQGPYDSPVTPVNNVNGSWRPEPTGLLAGFNGRSKAGVWILKVTDLGGGDTGTIMRFSLSIINTPEPASLGLLGLGAIGLLFRRRR